MKKNILIVDDSALMRRVICDILEADERFHVADRAKDGREALNLLIRNKYDAVILDVNMPVMNGLELLKELQKNKIPAKVMMASTDTKAGAQITLDALELGALDFVHKPKNALDCKEENFKKELLHTLAVVADSKEPVFEKKSFSLESIRETRKFVEIVRKHEVTGNKIVAIASSTGGPRALQSVIPGLPKDLNAPVVLVQHMPKGFTKSLAERLNSTSEITVTEAVEGEVLEKGHVYIARGGLHMNIVPQRSGESVIHYSDEPAREGVKPCANYMYESLANGHYGEVICAVLTGMGADGTAGILNLKRKRKIFVIAQQEDTCAVYGMPKSIVNAGVADHIVELDKIAQEIIMNVGVK